MKFRLALLLILIVSCAPVAQSWAAGEQVHRTSCRRVEQPQPSLTALDHDDRAIRRAVRRRRGRRDGSRVRRIVARSRQQARPHAFCISASMSIWDYHSGLLHDSRPQTTAIMGCKQPRSKLCCASAGERCGLRSWRTYTRRSLRKYAIRLAGA